MATSVQTEAPSTGQGRAGLSELVVPGLLLAIAAFIIVGTVQMEVPGEPDLLGPRFFPTVVSVLLLSMAALLTVQIVRHRTAPVGSPDLTGPTEADVGAVAVEHQIELPERGFWPPGAHSDWKALGTVLVSLVGFALLLEPVGWLIAAGLMFAGVAYALGDGTRVLDDLAVGLSLSSVIQVAFAWGLGLSLPPGILDGVF